MARHRHREKKLRRLGDKFFETVQLFRGDPALNF